MAAAPCHLCTNVVDDGGDSDGDIFVMLLFVLCVFVVVVADQEHNSDQLESRA